MTVYFLQGAGVPESDMSPQRYPLLGRVHSVFGSADVKAPPMPAPDDPNAQAWMDCMDVVLANVGPSDVVVGHSLGGSVFLKWVSERQANLNAKALLCCAAPYWGTGGWDGDSFALTGDIEAASAGIRQIVFCSAKDDDIVEIDHLNLYAGLLPRSEFVRLETGGHDLDTDEVDRVLRDLSA